MKPRTMEIVTEICMTVLGIVVLYHWGWWAWGAFVVGTVLGIGNGMGNVWRKG